MTGRTGAATPSAGTGATAGQTAVARSGTGDAKVEFTTCAATASGVHIAARTTNTTKEGRTFIITGIAKDAARKHVASAALMLSELKAGKTAEAVGDSTGSSKVVICEAAHIASMLLG